MEKQDKWAEEVARKPFVPSTVEKKGLAEPIYPGMNELILEYKAEGLAGVLDNGVHCMYISLQPVEHGYHRAMYIDDQGRRVTIWPKAGTFTRPDQTFSEG